MDVRTVRGGDAELSKREVISRPEIVCSAEWELTQRFEQRKHAPPRGC
jgi:hypothetical protein